MDTPIFRVIQSAATEALSGMVFSYPHAAVAMLHDEEYA